MNPSDGEHRPHKKSSIDSIEAQKKKKKKLSLLVHGLSPYGFS